MRVSYEWLQSFFEEPLPPPADVAHALTFGAFEIEGMEQKGDDTVFDIKVLPDRACYALSHRGIALEVAALCGKKVTYDPLRKERPALTPRASQQLSVSVEDTMRCPFYALARLEQIHVGPSPAWLVRRLEAIGQRSINTIVDATNYVMFELGTPLHAFDAKKVQGAITVRQAREGETITLLGGAECTLPAYATVIAEATYDTAIAVAGVKGGATAELTANTHSVLVEAATFDPVITRKVSQALGLRTDAAKRYESSVDEELPAYGLARVVELILEIAGGRLVGFASTELAHRARYKLGVSARDANHLLGTALTDDSLREIFVRMNVPYEEVRDPLKKVLELAPSFVGAPYKLGEKMMRSAPHTFECSTFTAYLFAQAGFSIPRVSVDQCLWGDKVVLESLEPGYLVFSNSGEGKIWNESCYFLPGKKVPEGIDHVGLYLGDGKVIHAARGPGKVVIEDLKESPGFKKVVAACRVFDKNDVRFVVDVPPERSDLRLIQDLIEEVGRVYGYERVTPQQLPPLAKKPEINQRHALTEEIRAILHESGCTEIFTYSLRGHGETMLLNALAADKNHLRATLTEAMQEELIKNERNAPLLSTGREIRLFEIGDVFPVSGEELHVAVGVRDFGKKRVAQEKEILDKVSAHMQEKYGVAPVITDSVCEWNLGGAVAQRTATAYPTLPVVATSAYYRPFSVYPFVLRDIALWAPVALDAERIQKIISEKGGPLLVRIDKFDEFSKEGRTSYAFHLVFQASDRTLSDTEVTALMDGVTGALFAQGGEPR
ncbi:MAG: phenylalanine--tRNA ligase beta subunit-related protein [Patescibacteria group bacterium]